MHENRETSGAPRVRYADDLVVGFENRMEAERFLKAFRDRLAKFGPELHPEKTRLIEFGRFAAPNREKRGEGKPEAFTFLGFTHYCGKRRGNGAFIVWRKTAKKRMVAKLHAIKAELRCRMHEPVADVGAWLRKVVNGYYRYHAVLGNISVPPDLHAVASSSTCSASLILSFAFSPLIQGGSRMRRRARTDLCGGRSATVVPTAIVIPGQKSGWRKCGSTEDHLL